MIFHWMFMIRLIVLFHRKAPVFITNTWTIKWEQILKKKSQFKRKNKANLMDLIAGTGLVILLKFDSNLRFFGPCDLENWWMTSKNSRAPLLYYVKLCAKFQSHRWIQTRAKVRKRSIQVKIGAFFRVTLTFDEWPSKSKGHHFCTSLSFVYHFVAIGEFKLELTETLNSGQNWWFFVCPVWPWNSTDDLEK